MAKRTAFTLVELLVVIGVITLLVGILTPTLMTVKQMARVTRCASNLNTTTRDILMYAEGNDGRLMPYMLKPNPSTGKPIAPETPWATTIAFGLNGDPSVNPDNGLLNDARNLGYGYVKDAFNDYYRLYCPDQPNEENTVSYYDKPWGTGDKMILTGYMYNPNVDLVTGGQTVYRYRPELEQFPNDRPLVCDLVYGENYLSHAIGREWRWNVSHVNGDVLTVTSKDGQAYVAGNPSADLPNDWSLFNSKVYRMILMR